MSLSYQRLRPVEVRDPRTILNNERMYAILKAGSETTYKTWTTTSVSSSSIQFSCPPPSGEVIVDRKVQLVLPIRLTITGTSPSGQLLLNPNTDAPRAYPISSSIETLKATINNQSMSINMADVIQPLMHYNTCEDLSQTEYSETPNVLDQSQAYSNLYGANRNPLGFYGDSVDQSMMPRGGFPFTIVSNTQTSAVVDFVATEFLYLSPFYWGMNNGSGFYNVNAMDFNITFLGNAGNRMWSHDAVSGSGTTISAITAQFANFTGTAFSYSTGAPLMNFCYLTPLETQKLPYNMPITYPYFDVQRFPTDFGGVITAGTAFTFNSNNIQLSSIPRRMYLFIRERNQDLYNTCQNPDTYFSIENISVQFQNKQGLFASASKRQLYEMSVKNHCKMSWTEWSGDNVYPVGSFANPFGTIGTIICIEFASDIGLNDIEAPGKLGQYTLQIQGNATNKSARSINPTTYIVIVSEGTFTIEGLGKSSTNIGVISSQDILDASMSPFVSYNDVQCVNGGNFLSGLKDFGNKIWSGIKEYGPKILSGIQKYGPTVLKGVETVAPLLGLGEEHCRHCKGRGKTSRGGCAICHGSGVLIGGVAVGGVPVGGRNLSRSDLRNRMMAIDI